MIDTTCTAPPSGWYCTRINGHAGPCAAHPIQPNTDQLALDCATEIMALLDKPMPVGQLKAKIQCVIIDLLEECK